MKRESGQILTQMAMALILACGSKSAAEGAKAPEPIQATVEWTSEAMQLSAVATVTEYAYGIRRSAPRGDQADHVPTFYRGEPVYVAVRTTNLAEEARSFLLTGGIWQLSVTDAAGRAVPLNAYGRWLRGPEGRSRLQGNLHRGWIPAGAPMTQVYNVSDLHDLSIAGRYCIRLSRTSDSAADAGERGTVVSPPLGIEVLDSASPWGASAKLKWGDNRHVRSEAAQTVKALAQFVADKLAESAAHDPEQRVREKSLAELTKLRDDMNGMMEAAEQRPGASAVPAAAQEQPEEGAVEETIWPNPPAGGPAQLQSSLQRTSGLTAYRYTADWVARNGSVINGNFTGWAEVAGTVEQAQYKEWNIRTRIVRKDTTVMTSGGLKRRDETTLAIITRNIGWLYQEEEARADRLRFFQRLQTVGMERTRAAIVDWRLEHDPVAWLFMMDPTTAEVVEIKTEKAPGGTETRVCVIEGKPVERLLANADRFQRAKMPVEPLLRITVGEDGFPRHVLVQRYGPRWAVLDITVTSFEPNPELLYNTFQFTPPEGVQVIEADPSMWK